MEETISIKIDRSLYDEFRLIAKKEDRFATGLIRRALRNFLKAKKGRGNKK